MKFRDYILGLALNSFPCFLCDSSFEDMYSIEKITEGFVMTRKYLGLKQASQALMYNPEDKDWDELVKIAKGSKGIPLLQSNMEKSSYDCLHFLLSMGRLIYNVFYRINSGIRGKWDIPAAEKDYAKFYEQELQDNLAKHLGIFCPNGQLDGNKVRKMIDPDNHDKIMKCINENIDDDTRNHLSYVIQEISYIYCVVASHSPKEFFCLQEFDRRAKNLLIFIRRRYPWWNCGSYLHIACCHTVEILKNTDSIGLYSTEVCVYVCIVQFEFVRLFYCY